MNLVQLQVLVNALLRDHPSECIFKANTAHLIVSHVRARRPLGEREEAEALLDAFHDAELYCPHEGVDRMPSP